MRAGRLRHRLVLQKQVATSSPQTKDAYGQVVDSWVTQATVWGGIEPLSGREYLAEQQVQTDITVRIVMRYRNIDPSWRIMNGNRIYTIHTVLNENERDRMLTLMCHWDAGGGTEDAETGIPTTALYDVDLNALTFVDTNYFETVD